MMDTKLAAKFPFLEDATEMAAENEAYIDKLLTSFIFEDARARGVERLEDAIKNSEISYVPLNKEDDRLTEVMSYPYARMIVSCIDDRFLTKRYALAEAKRMNRLLGDEPYPTILKIATALGVRSQTDENGLMMHFSRTRTNFSLGSTTFPLFISVFTSFQSVLLILEENFR